MSLNIKSTIYKCHLLHNVLLCKLWGRFCRFIRYYSNVNIHLHCIIILQGFPNVILKTCCILGNHILWSVILGNLTAIFNLLFFWGNQSKGSSMSIHFLWIIKIVHLIMLIMQCFFSFSDMSAYCGKSFFGTFLQSQISEKPKSFWKKIVTMA